MRIIYYCNNPKTPAGGANVIYRQIQQLNNMGVDSAVLHVRKGHRYRWSHYDIPHVTDKELRTSDYFVVPEILAAEIASKLVPSNIPYSIFVQNGYYLPYSPRSYTEKDIDFAYKHANHILTISDHATEMVKLHYPFSSHHLLRMYCSIDASQFYAGEEKENLISYMPRKNHLHAEALIFALKKNLPSDWHIQPIDQLSQHETAKILRKSRLFLSFSNLEGLGLPPIEAALCGNYVIGYHGGGGMDYWQTPNFEEIEVGNIIQFVEKILQRIAFIQNDSSLGLLKPGIQLLKSIYSEEKEKEQLKQFIKSIQTRDTPALSKPISIPLQRNLGFMHNLMHMLGMR